MNLEDHHHKTKAAPIFPYDKRTKHSPNGKKQMIAKSLMTYRKYMLQSAQPIHPLLSENCTPILGSAPNYNVQGGFCPPHCQAAQF